MVLFLRCIETTNIIKQTNKKKERKKRIMEKKKKGEQRGKGEKKTERREKMILILCLTLRFPKSAYLKPPMVLKL